MLDNKTLNRIYNTLGSEHKAAAHFEIEHDVLEPTRLTVEVMALGSVPLFRLVEPREEGGYRFGRWQLSPEFNFVYTRWARDYGTVRALYANGRLALTRYIPQPVVG